MQLESDDEETNAADEGLSVMQDKTNSRKGKDDNRIQDMEEESSKRKAMAPTRAHRRPTSSRPCLLLQTRYS
ncbi:hypothetical protein NQ318_007074 [Aromia moschata]|uniref:Uncharacterized protein n=1 Tax=Aromia moschata TaxID=1265417 RepID=A0AAV8X8H7_9CUCU|nr:hypothetical protein NQ318_007074 [Aromia moschata]